jgi:hypothetical protein
MLKEGLRGLRSRSRARTRSGRRGSTCRIDGEIQALLEHDPAQAERWFLNRKMAGESAAFDVELYKLLAEPRNVPDKVVIAIGVDGARFRDALSIEATDISTGYQWTAGLWERPKMAERPTSTRRARSTR